MNELSAVCTIWNCSVSALFLLKSLLDGWFAAERNPCLTETSWTENGSRQSLRDPVSRKLHVVRKKLSSLGIDPWTICLSRTSRQLALLREVDVWFTMQYLLMMMALPVCWFIATDLVLRKKQKDWWVIKQQKLTAFRLLCHMYLEQFNEIWLVAHKCHLLKEQISYLMTLRALEQRFGNKSAAMFQCRSTPGTLAIF